MRWGRAVLRGVSLIVCKTSWSPTGILARTVPDAPWRWRVVVPARGAWFASASSGAWCRATTCCMDCGKRSGRSASASCTRRADAFQSVRVAGTPRPGRGARGLRGLDRGPGRGGVSGGLDSTVLLHAVATVAAPDRVRAIHVNHGLHEAADAWERRCEAFAATLSVPFDALRVRVRAGNVEAGARRARYRAWTNALAPAEVLLLAHHADDQAETVVWQFATGRAPVGMPRARPLGAGRLLRPLLALRRRTLEAYARKHRLRWVEDDTNADTTHDRNYLRHVVLPRGRGRGFRGR